MIGFLLVTHGEMSDGLFDAAKLILGDVENLETLNLYPEDDVSKLKDEILAAYNKIDQDEGVIIFTDLMSASPFNQATMAINELSEKKQEKTTIFAGVNLPMLLEAVNQNMMHASIEDTIAAVEETGKEGIVKWSIADVPVDDDDDF
jgi:PTS system mannose-specific IIA component